MKAIVYENFREKLNLVTVSDPTPEDHGVVIKVEATGMCLSDWHGWMGHDKDITLPNIPRHELAGIIVAFRKKS